MESQTIRLRRDTKKAVRTGVRAAGFVFGILGILAFFLPYVIVRLDNFIIRFTGLSIFLNNIRLANGILLEIPLLLRISFIAVLLSVLAGVILLVRKKDVLAAGFYFLAILFTALQTIFLSELKQSVIRAGAATCETESEVGYLLMLLLFLLAAIATLLLSGKEKAAETIFKLAATISIGIVAIITIYMFIYGSPAIVEIGLFRFIFGTTWLPTAAEPQFGIFYMILASIFACIGAILIGVPIALLTAVFLSEIAPKWVVSVVRPAVELLAGIPSVIYGFWGMKVLVPLLRDISTKMGINSTGSGLLAVILILAVMILPTIIRVAETSLLSVPSSYTEASLALGNTKISTIFQVQIPAARSGILAGVILGVGRAIGETMAVIMVAGNIVRFPELFNSIRPLTAGIAFEMGYAEAGLHRQSLFAIGLVLFIFIMLVNISFTFISKQGVKADAK